MTEIIFATGNKDKMREIREIMADCDVHIVSMKEAGIRVDIVEDGTTFEENAKIKARAVAAHTDAIVLADDSGLEIDALNKEPGVYSARYMGEDTSYDVKNKNLIDRLDGVPKEKRTARFVCAIAAVLPDGRELVTRQTMEGYIGWEPEGENGFGYDPIFYLDEYGCSSAAISPEQKNAISHRGKALRAMKELLKKAEFLGLIDEIEKNISIAYELNHPNVRMLNCDINVLTEDILNQALNGQKIDIVVGGPPCQSYSTLGKRQNDERANLFMQYKRILKILRPKAFVFENVTGILSMNKGNLFKQIQIEFEELGYDLKHKVLDAVDYGVPQHRERVILVGIKGKNNFVYPSPTHGEGLKLLNRSLTAQQKITADSFVCSVLQS